MSQCIKTGARVYNMQTCTFMWGDIHSDLYNYYFVAGKDAVDTGTPEAGEVVHGIMQGWDTFRLGSINSPDSVLYFTFTSPKNKFTFTGYEGIDISVVGINWETGEYK